MVDKTQLLAELTALRSERDALREQCAALDAEIKRARQQWAIEAAALNSLLNQSQGDSERLLHAASAVLFFRNKDGSFVDGWRAQEVLNALAAMFPGDYAHWPRPADSPVDAAAVFSGVLAQRACQCEACRKVAALQATNGKAG